VSFYLTHSTEILMQEFGSLGSELVAFRCYRVVVRSNIIFRVEPKRERTSLDFVAKLRSMPESGDTYNKWNILTSLVCSLSL
jgi:hypothetical protein